MKTIGLLGGMSWESTVTYYQTINRLVKKQLGGHHSAKILLYSVNFAELEAMMASGQWAQAGALLHTAALNLQKAGADFVLICTNTLHKVAHTVQNGLSIPLLHIAQVTADALLAQKITRAALLGTQYTMEQDFYRKTLESRGIEVVTPPAQAREWLNRVVFEELCLGVVLPQSKAGLLEIIAALHAQGAQGIILGCTELGLLVAQLDTEAPLVDTALIHAQRAALLALE